MAINGQLTGAGLGRLLVSGLKAGKPGAARVHADSNLRVPRQAEDGGQEGSDTHHRDAAEAGNGAQSKSEIQGDSSPVPGNPFDGQTPGETPESPAIEDGTGAQDSIETHATSSPGADHLVTDQTASETHSASVGDSGGTTEVPKPPQRASRRILLADQSFTVTQEEDVGGDGDGTKVFVEPMGAMSRHHPISDDHAPPEIHSSHVVGGNDRAHHEDETQPPLSPVIAQLIQAARLRRRWHKAEKSLILQGRALCRAWTGGDKIAANGLFDRAAAGEANDPVILVALSPFLAAIEKFASERAAIEKDLRKLARQLPVWKGFAEGVKGLGELRLALVVGECGDIGSYRNPSCVWKRMGLAVIDGDRQRRKTDPDEALRNGYNAERRAMAYVLGTELIKAQLRAPKDEDGKRTDGETTAIGAYGQIYLDRRAYETAREIPKAHAHNRAARYMTKRLFRDLYAAWRK